MKTFIDLGQLNTSFLENLWRDFLNFIPKLFLGILFVILAYLTIKIVGYVLTKLLKITKIDSITTKLNEAELFGKNDYNVVPSKIIVKFVKYLLVLIFVIIAAEMLGLEMVSKGIGNFIAYLPILISALLIFVVGVYLASRIKTAIVNTFKSLEITGGNLVGNIAFYAMVVVISITSLNQAGIDTEIITNNLTLILGSVFVAFTIAFGLGARDVISRLLFGFYTRRNFYAGQHIKTETIEGVIEQIDNICITIRTKDGLVYMPIKKFVDQDIEVKQS